MIRSKFCLLAFLGIAACGLNTKNQSNYQNAPFFDLSGFISTYVKDSSSHKVSKTIQVDTSVESKILDNYPIWKDIKDFDAYDINRPALYDKYSIDTIISASAYSIIYLPKEDTKDLKVTRLQVNVENGEVTSIQIKTSNNSFLDQVKMEINWTPRSGYILERVSDKIFRDQTELQTIEVSIIS